MKLSMTIGALCVATAPAFAAPYCDALLHKEQLEKRYQRLAPIENSANTGWIFTADQMDVDYEMSSEVTMLMTGIIEAIEAQNTQLTILTAPPRPIVAGQEIVDLTYGRKGAFDVATAAASFDTLVAQLRDAGATVPNLLTAAQAAEDSAPYYFQRDTHWTSTGAALSALALAEEMDVANSFAISQLAVLDTYEERGSLSDIVDATCGMRDAAEMMPVYDYTSVADANGLGLLDDTSSTRTQVALLGTSFSNRYRRDQYQAADALAAALNADIENLSVSGGGLIGPMEEYVLSGALYAGSRDMVIWEFPYTESLNTSPLRQLLGALKAQGAAEMDSFETAMSDGSATFDLQSRAVGADLLHIQLDTDQAREVRLALTFADGTSKTVKLRRKSSMQEVAQHADWYAYVGGYKYGDVVAVEMKTDSQANAGFARLSVMGSATN
ncbi:MAG: hypothetical protein AAFQ64_06835 [Pseudomonadota bacterium]